VDYIYLNLLGRVGLYVERSFLDWNSKNKNDSKQTSHRFNLPIAGRHPE
jgi:hypothetical protein